ncbi:hypothetical protein EGW08_000361, partial [Elysia chlorotica]
MPAAARPLCDMASPILDSGVAITGEHHEGPVDNHNQSEPFTAHFPSVLGLESSSCIFNTCSGDCSECPDIVTSLLCSDGFYFGLNNTHKSCVDKPRYCVSDIDMFSSESASSCDGRELHHNGQMNAPCTNDVFQRLVPSDAPETSSRTEADPAHCSHAGHRGALDHRPMGSTTLAALSIFVVLALLNGSASASKDFYFPDSNQGNFAQDLTHFHISWPSRVDQHGDFVTHTLHARHAIPSRQRRSAPEGLNQDQPNPSHLQQPALASGREDVLHYRIPVHADKDVVVELQSTRFLLGPAAVLEKVSSPRNVSQSLFSRLEGHHGCQLSGSVRGDPTSRVALSACQGLRGFIQVDGIEYLIEPVKSHNKTEDGSHPHLVYRRSALPDHLDFLSRRRRKEPACGVKEYERTMSHRERWERHKRGASRSRSHETSGRERSRKRRSISIEKHVETLIVVDPEMVQFYINEDIETYVLTVMNMVATLFHDASIGNAVNIVIVRIMLLQDPDEELTITHHADNTLRSFCKWQKNINFRDDDHPNHHDVAVLLTRRNICTRMNEPCSTLGLAQVAGLCQPHRTCSINEDTGLSLAWTVAHELGHNFGMKHDVQGECKPGPDNQYVMAPHLTWDRTPRSWSNCSRTSITEFLDRNWGYCLDDPPGQHDFKYPTLPAGTMYDADHQCRLLYGEGAESCKGIELLENICVTLWCRVNNKCSTKLQAAAAGTLCGANKWCFNGQCVDIG